MGFGAVSVAFFHDGRAVPLVSADETLKRGLQLYGCRRRRREFVARYVAPRRSSDARRVAAKRRASASAAVSSHLCEQLIAWNGRDQLSNTASLLPKRASPSMGLVGN